MVYLLGTMESKTSVVTLVCACSISCSFSVTSATVMFWICSELSFLEFCVSDNASKIGSWELITSLDGLLEFLLISSLSNIVWLLNSLIPGIVWFNIFSKKLKMLGEVAKFSGKLATSVLEPQISLRVWLGIYCFSRCWFRKITKEAKTKKN